MAFAEIENAKPVNHLNAVPRGGVLVQARKLTVSRRPGAPVRSYIRIVMGAGLAAKLALQAERHNLRILFGTGEDAGKIMIAVDNEKGPFSAKRAKNGTYATTINEASADGLFAMNFPAFAVLDVEVVKAPGCPPAAIFPASAEMLAVED